MTDPEAGPLTRSFTESVADRVRRDPEFRSLLIEQAALDSAEMRSEGNSADDHSSSLIDGVVSKLYGEAREAPGVYDDAEASDWLKGYDA